MDPLDVLFNTDSSDTDFLAAWARLGQPGFLLERLRDRLRQDSAAVPGACRAAWDPYAARFTADMLSLHFHAVGSGGLSAEEEPVLTGRLVRCLQGPAAAAAALLAAESGARPDLLRNLLRASWAWSDGRDGTDLEGGFERLLPLLDAARGFLPDAILAFVGRVSSAVSRGAALPDQGLIVPHPAGLAALATWCGGGPLAVGPVRDVIAFLTGDSDLRRRRVLRRVGVPVLFAGRGRHEGVLARLWVEVIADGTGELYPDPVR
jgi:hypothetical protein